MRQDERRALVAIVKALEHQIDWVNWFGDVKAKERIRAELKSAREPLEREEPPA